MNATISDLREDINDLIYDLKDDISTLNKKVDSLYVDIENTNRYEYGDSLVISGDIIPHGTPTENFKDFIIIIHLSSYGKKKHINDIDNRKIFLNQQEKN